MGGILSAEVVLLGTAGAESPSHFRHRILGTINLDTPFLGLHQGVIASGIQSIFTPTPQSPNPRTEASSTQSRIQQLDSPALSRLHTPNIEPDQGASGASDASILLPAATASQGSEYFPTTTPTVPPQDPNYDPAFPNDVLLPERSGFSNALHFIGKHSSGLARATQTMIKSHWDFGAAMGDFVGLKQRYQRIRALEDIHSSERVRFVNYYTASTGRPKKQKLQASAATEATDENDLDKGIDNLTVHNAPAPEESGSPLPRNPSTASSTRSLAVLNDPRPEEAESSATQDAQGDLSRPTASRSVESINSLGFEADSRLPPIPALPAEPERFVPESEDPKERKFAEQQNQRQIKAYQRLLKDRENAIKARQKFVEKREKEAAKAVEASAKKGEKERAKAEKAEAKRAAKAAKAREEEAKAQEGRVVTLAAIGSDEEVENEAKGKGRAEERVEEKAPRDRKFCRLAKGPNGEVDPCWIRVYMPGVDEVGAHCGLFAEDGDRYEGFVAAVGMTVVGWAKGE
ncbi:MAG: hypothetical protein OHK93_006167 [Ramalina farinacea]|uniref:Uncharacterized protein n=1 Tax=Ramalina farinacea TaxID=258253 RepID=A0AA43QMB0_9LECA|nr:hypothetical protein [Ramalina farinacea]